MTSACFTAGNKTVLEENDIVCLFVCLCNVVVLIMMMWCMSTVIVCNNTALTTSQMLVQFSYSTQTNKGSQPQAEIISISSWTFLSFSNGQQGVFLRSNSTVLCKFVQTDCCCWNR
mmetsp:Transcript_21180/g.50355  ORF Transcript_21180/g.50355 Transcript_21180/m.50355 type:complete len:116 (-) Transcript_21180:179-526(-)